MVDPARIIQELNQAGVDYVVIGGIAAVAHTGEQPGASSILYVMPGELGSFAILANTDAAGLWKLADQLADLLSKADKSN